MRIAADVMVLITKMRESIFQHFPIAPYFVVYKCRRPSVSKPAPYVKECSQNCGGVDRSSFHPCLQLGELTARLATPM